MNFIENITLRRKRTQSDNMNRTNNINTPETTIDESATSLPDISDDDLDQVMRLKERIDALQTELKCAHSEIETLSVENNELKRTNEELSKQNELLKKNMNSPIKLRMTPKKKTKKKTNVQNEIVCRNEHHKASHSQNIIDKSSNTQYKTTTTCKHTQNINPPNKICILSCHKYNKILSISENTLSGYSKLCHYLTPNGNIREMIRNIDSKLKGFTKDDYCIILIGDNDFKMTINYLNLISEIREKLQSLEYTNIIMCLPTFKWGNKTNMFNGRIETFNNLLYLDAQTHKYAHIVDVNEILESNGRIAFHKHFGSINNNGIRILLQNLQNYILNLQYLNSTKELAESDTHSVKDDNQSPFFRDSIYLHSSPKHCGSD